MLLLGLLLLPRILDVGEVTVTLLDAVLGWGLAFLDPGGVRSMDSRGGCGGE
jgi:hypothetical protein